MILSLSCDAPEFLNAIVLFKKILLLAQIAAPIVLVIVSSIDIVKAVTAGDQELIAKHVHKIPKRLMALSVVYLAPLIINMTVSYAEDISEYSECYNKATEGNVLIAYQNKAESLVAKAEKERTKETLNEARGYLTRLSDESLKKALSERLDKVASYITQKEKAEEEERRKKYETDPTPSGGGGSKPTVIPSSDGYYKYASAGGIDNPLGIPYFFQCDTRWNGANSYNGFNSCLTACGYNSFAMIVAGLTKNPDITPKTIFADYGLSSKANDFGSFEYPSNAYGDVTTIAAKYGLDTSVVYPYNSGTPDEKKLQLIKAALQKGHPIILNVPNHYVALVGYDEKGIYVHDPGWPQNNGIYGDAAFLQKMKSINGGYGLDDINKLRAAFEFYKK